MVTRFRGDRGELIPKGRVAARRAIASAAISSASCQPLLHRESVENLIFLISERFGQAADWAPQLRNQKFADSPLEEAVKSEPVSEWGGIPC